MNYILFENKAPGSRSKKRNVFKNDRYKVLKNSLVILKFYFKCYLVLKII